MLPKNINFPLTYKCNSRCRMCHVWDRKESSNELSADEFEKYLFSVPLFYDNVELISFTGGEFCLRDDAFQIIEKSFYYTKNLKEATFLSNGLSGKKLTGLIKRILELKTGSHVKKSFFISIDGIGSPHDLNRGIQGAYEKSMKTLKEIIEITYGNNQAVAGILSTLGPDNCDQAEALIGKSRELGVDIAFQYYRDDSYFCNEAEELYNFTDNQKKKLIKTFKYIFKELGKESSLTAIDGLRMNVRKQKCFHLEKGLLITPRGNVYPCGMLEKDKFLAGNIASDGFEKCWNARISNDFIKLMMEDRCHSCPIALGSANYKRSLRARLKRLQAKLFW